MAQGKSAISAPRWYDDGWAKAGAIVVVALGIVPLAIIVGVNYDAMTAYANNVTQQWVMGSSAFVIEAFGVFALGLVGAILWRKPRRIMAGFCYFVAILSACFSLQMFYSFTAATRIKPAIEAKWQNEAETAAKRKGEAKSAELLEGNVEFLRKQAEKATKAAADKDNSRT
jgi:hypothetical protein